MWRFETQKSRVTGGIMRENNKMCFRLLNDGPEIQTQPALLKEVDRKTKCEDATETLQMEEVQEETGKLRKAAADCSEYIQYSLITY